METFEIKKKIYFLKNSSENTFEMTLEKNRSNPEYEIFANCRYPHLNKFPHLDNLQILFFTEHLSMK